MPPSRMLLTHCPVTVVAVPVGVLPVARTGGSFYDAIQLYLVRKER